MKDIRMTTAIFEKDIRKAKKAYTKGMRIRVLRRDELVGELMRDTYEVVRHFPNLIVIRSTRVERARKQGASEELLKKLERLYTTTITNAELVMYINHGKKAIIL